MRAALAKQLNNDAECNSATDGFRSATPKERRSDGALASADGFKEMVAAFEQAMSEAPNPPGVATRREKSFFEKPVSTYLLVVFTLVLSALGVALFASSRPVRGNFIGVLGTYVAYMVAWRAAAAQRNAP